MCKQSNLTITGAAFVQLNNTLSINMIFSTYQICLAVLYYLGGRENKFKKQNYKFGENY